MELVWSRKWLKTLEGVTIPEDVRTLYLNFNELTSLKGARFPRGLIKLNLDSNKIVDIDGFEFPSSLETLKLYGNEISSIEQAVFPESLKHLSLYRNNLTDVAGGKFPENLTSLSLDGNEHLDLRHANFPEMLERLDIRHTRLSFRDDTEGLYIHPDTWVCYSNHRPSISYWDVSDAPAITCTRAILCTPSPTTLPLRAWWARTSYLLGGATFQEVEEAFTKK